MKIKILYVDENFYSKLFENEGVLVLFQKPKGVSEKECEFVSSEIMKIFLKYGINVSHSDLVNEITNFEFVESINNTLYVRIDKEDDYISQHINPTYHQKNIELSIKNKTIAKMSLDKNRSFLIPAILTIVSLIFTLYIVDYCENKRTKADNTSHLHDTEAYKKNINEIDEVASYLSSRLSENQELKTFIDQNLLNIIQNDINSLRKKIKDNYQLSLSSEDYTNVNINVFDFKSKINALIKEAEIKSTDTSKKRFKETEKRETKKSNNNSTRYSRNNSKFSHYVELGDAEYKRYYSSGDESSARKAILNYQNALKIKYDQHISTRILKLKKSIKQ